MRHMTAGLSLVEVVVATALLVTVLAISAGILTALGNTRTTRAVSDSVNSAQQAAELVRGLWGTDPVLYRGTCVNRQGVSAAEALEWPAGVHVTEVRNLDVNGNSTGVVALSGVTLNCTASDAVLAARVAPPFRQVTVTSSAGPGPRTLVVLVARP